MANGQLTENGKAAVIAALDPMHDLQIEHLRGWPDYETAPSVIRTVRHSTTVTPGSLGAGVNALMLMSMPIAHERVTNRCSRRNNIIDAITESESTDFDLNLLNIRAYVGTDNMILTNGVPVTGLGLDPEYLQDSCRVIGVGVEVYDVTADIYRQGTCTTFQIPQSTSEPDTFLVKTVTGETIIPTPIQGLPLKKWPTTLSQIMQMEGTRQWKAAEGAYTVIPFHGRDNFSGQPTYEIPLVYVDTTASGEDVSFLNVAPFNVGTWVHPQDLTDEPIVFYANKFLPMHSKGILLSGLNELSTFTVNTIVYLESFPAPDDVSLVTLARPSACLDELALEMISSATQKLPIAVPVGMNGLGDWFAEVVAEVAPWIGAASTGLGFAPGAAAATAASAAAKAYMSTKAYEPTGGMFSPAAKRAMVSVSKGPAAAKNAKSKQPSPPSTSGKGAQQQAGKKKEKQNQQLPKLSQLSEGELKHILAQASQVLEARSKQKK